MKKLILLKLMVILFVGCSDFEEPLKEVDLESIAIEKEYLSFATKEESQEKLNQILTLKERYNQSAYQILFPESEDTSNKFNKDEDLEIEISEEEVNKSVKEYHTLLLNNVYSLRKELSFTSIQSIADEINSLELLDPAKADKLYGLYQEHLIRTELGVSTIYEEPMAELISHSGELKLEGEFLDLAQFRFEENAYLDFSKLLEDFNNAKDNKKALSSITAQSGPTYPRHVVRIIGYRYNLFLVVWDAGRARNRYNWWYRYDYYSRLTTWCRIGNRFYRYPVSSFSLDYSQNFTEFRKRNSSSWIRANTPSSGGGNHYFIGRHSRSSSKFRFTALT
jgi:hypothetical protein